MGWITLSIAVLIILIVLFLLNFYRDPKRKIPKGNNIVAPADGKVISITETSGKPIKVRKGVFGKIKTIAQDISEQCYAISIFMSPLDVHINRAPISGIVKSVKYTKGKFYEAYDLERSLQNEKNEIIIQNKKLKVKVIQVAGFLARRIKCYAKKNQKINKGAKIGMIVLGSQTMLILPKGVDLKVNVEDKVKAGETIIANLR